MERRLSLSGGPGTLILRENGPRVTVLAERPDDGKGLYKAWIWGENGRFLLGTMLPERNCLRAERTLSVDQLSRQGVWPVTGASAVLAFCARPGGAPPQGWKRHQRPQELFSDCVLQRAARGLDSALICRRERGFSLAFAYQPRHTFPLVPAFCFARMEKLGNGFYLIFEFNEEGWPIPPDRTSSS
ncbi:MAG: hypothetical protein LKK00_03395 [Intestinimonas sp.]|jgi:hypothetical protein|nr:hypothetical protein [Intestinimonas sp.]